MNNKMNELNSLYEDYEYELQLIASWEFEEQQDILKEFENL